MHDLQLDRLRMKRSLKRGYTTLCASVRNLLCTSIEME